MLPRPPPRPIPEPALHRDPVKQNILTMLKFMRTHHKENLELEIRVGQFNSSNEFHPGYTQEHRQLSKKLAIRMEKNSQHPTLSQTWEMVPKYIMMRCEYEQGVRKTCIPGRNEEFMTKKRVGKLDLTTDRQYQIRLALSRETKVNLTKGHHMYERVKRGPPISVRYLQRGSFMEKLSGPHGNEFCFQWDISKVSTEAPNKNRATKHPCSYHCEVELKSKLKPLADKVTEQEEDLWLADHILARARVLLGTHYKETPEAPASLLPAAKFFILTKDV